MTDDKRCETCEHWSEGMRSKWGTCMRVSFRHANDGCDKWKSADKKQSDTYVDMVLEEQALTRQERMEDEMEADDAKD